MPLMALCAALALALALSCGCAGYMPDGARPLDPSELAEARDVLALAGYTDCRPEEWVIVVEEPCEFSYPYCIAPVLAMATVFAGVPAIVASPHLDDRTAAVRHESLHLAGTCGAGSWDVNHLSDRWQFVYPSRE